MSTLTQKERDALEDVYLSIGTPKSEYKYKKIKFFIRFWIDVNISKAPENMRKSAQTGKFGDKSKEKFGFFTKVKKFLSK